MIWDYYETVCRKGSRDLCGGVKIMRKAAPQPRQYTNRILSTHTTFPVHPV